MLRALLYFLFRTCQLLFEVLYQVPVLVLLPQVCAYHVESLKMNPSSAQASYSSAAQSTAVPCGAVPCRAVRCCGMLRCAFFRTYGIVVLGIMRSTRYRYVRVCVVLVFSLSSFDCPLSVLIFFLANFTPNADQKVTSPTSTHSTAQPSTAQSKTIPPVGGRFFWALFCPGSRTTLATGYSISLHFYARLLLFGFTLFSDSRERLVYLVLDFSAFGFFACFSVSHRLR